MELVASSFYNSDTENEDVLEKEFKLEIKELIGKGSYG